MQHMTLMQLFIDSRKIPKRLWCYCRTVRALPTKGLIHKRDVFALCFSATVPQLQRLMHFWWSCNLWQNQPVSWNGPFSIRSAVRLAFDHVDLQMLLLSMNEICNSSQLPASSPEFSQLKKLHVLISLQTSLTQQAWHVHWCAKSVSCRCGWGDYLCLSQLPDHVVIAVIGLIKSSYTS